MRIVLLIALSLATSVIPCRAILNDMVPTGIEVVGKVDNPPKPSKWSDVGCALFKFEVDKGDNLINGKKITALWNNGIIKPGENDCEYDAYANAEVGQRPNSITLHHPDFNNIRVEFKDVPAIGSVKEGVVYKIKLKIPSPQLIEANSCFNDLDFTRAKKLYRQIVDGAGRDSEEKIIARNQLADIDSLVSWGEKAKAYEQQAETLSGKERSRALYRARIFYNAIFRDQGIINAGLKADKIDGLLGLNAKKKLYGSINRIKPISAEMIPNSTQAVGNGAVKYEYVDSKGVRDSKSASLLIIEVPLNDAKIESDRSAKPLEFKNGENWMYVKTEVDSKHDPNPVLFTINHPDFMPFEFRLRDFTDGSELLPQTTYRIKLDTPSLVMTMANKHLSSLNLNSAANFFRYNYADAEEQHHAEECLKFLESPTVKVIANNLDNMVKKWRKAEKEYFSITSGATTFDTPAERTAKLNAVNVEIENQAVKLSSSYRTICDEASRNGIVLDHARDLADEYASYCEGVRRLPLIIEFKEMRKKLTDGAYAPPTMLASQPVVRIEILSDDNKVVELIEQKVKDSKVSCWINARASRLFKEGSGRIQISTPKDLNYDRSLRNVTPYDKTEHEISKFKVNDFSTKKLNVVLIQK